MNKRLPDYNDQEDAFLYVRGYFLVYSIQLAIGKEDVYG